MKEHLYSSGGVLLIKGGKMELVLIGIAIFGFFAILGFFKSKKCPSCKGSGYEPSGANEYPRECFTCKGTGRIVK